MPTFTEAVRERMIGHRDEVDGIHLEMRKIEGYLKQFVLWIRILIRLNSRLEFLCARSERRIGARDR